ncbi:hypothetical protein GW17_00041755 [Ensete ventricosum]|nr:hypothetical protein GW17_00041755 [Ensete ventricosum]
MDRGIREEKVGSGGDEDAHEEKDRLKDHCVPSVELIDANPPKVELKDPELIINNRPRSSLGIGPSSDDEVGSRRKFARRFAEWIRKLAGNTNEDRREKDRRTCSENAGGCRIMRDRRPNVGLCTVDLRLLSSGTLSFAERASYFEE